MRLGLLAAVDLSIDMSTSMELIWSVKRLVEGGCAIKHTKHIRHVGHVPLVERLVEGFCAKKHVPHTH